MTTEQFENWLTELKAVWETKDPEAAANLCADKFSWYETPFLQVITTEEELIKEWNSVLSHENISLNYEILNFEQGIGIAHWTASFTRIPSNEKVEMDGIFKVTLDENGKCTEFHQWYNSK